MGVSASCPSLSSPSNLELQAIFMFCTRVICDIWNNREGDVFKGDKMKYISCNSDTPMANRGKWLKTFLKKSVIWSDDFYPQHALSFAVYKLGVYVKANACSPFPVSVDSPSWLTPASSVENEDILSMLKLLDCSALSASENVPNESSLLLEVTK